MRLIRPVGERPRGTMRSLGWVLLALLIQAVVAAALMVAAIPLVIALTPESTMLRLSAGLVYASTVSALTVVCSLLLTKRARKLRWAIWWAVAVSSVVRLAFGIAAFMGTSALWRFGFNASAFYDFNAQQWSWGLVACVDSLSALTALYLVTKREVRVHEVRDSAAAYPTQLTSAST